MKYKREIVIDEEMTCLDLAGGDRVVEMSAVELINGIPSGKTFHAYTNPEGRPMSAIAAKMTGLTDAFLATQPPFSAIAQSFKDFVGDSKIIVFCWTENGSSPDQNFLNAEMVRAGLPAFPPNQFLNIRDWAAKMYTLGKGSLNQMLDHYKIDRASRNDETGHTATTDALLTAKLYPLLEKDWKKHNRRPKNLQPQ